MSGFDVDMVDPTTLEPAPYNPRHPISGRKRSKLRAGLEEFGFVAPVVVNRRDGKRRIVGGHQRVDIAITDLQLETVPVRWIDVDEDRERALNVLLNNEEAQSGWDGDQLVAVLESIEDTPMLELTGFDFDQWQQLQVDVGAATKVGREGTVRSPAKKGTRTKTKPGHVWQLGQHLLVVGDATSADVYEHLPEPAQMMFTDPPYNVDYKGRTSDELTILNDAMTDAEYVAFITDFARAATPSLAGAAYMCHATRTSNEVRTALRLAGWHESSVIAWVKQHFVMGRSDYHWMWEPIWYGWPDGTERHWIGDRNQGNVWEHGDTTHARRASGRMRNRGKQQSTTKANTTDVWKHPRPSANKDHPTMKPVALVEHAIRNSSEPNRWVLDPMAGSGSTLIAAENLGRRCYAVELDPIYADVILERYKSLAGAEKPERIHP